MTSHRGAFLFLTEVLSAWARAALIKQKTRILTDQKTLALICQKLFIQCIVTMNTVLPSPGFPSTIRIPPFC